MTADKYDEMAKALRQCGNPHCDRGICEGGRCWTCGGDGFVEPDAEAISAALRKAVEEEREAIATEMEQARDRADKHRCPSYESCIYCARRDAYEDAADTLRARGAR